MIELPEPGVLSSTFESTAHSYSLFQTKSLLFPHPLNDANVRTPLIFGACPFPLSIFFKIDIVLSANVVPQSTVEEGCFGVLRSSAHVSSLMVRLHCVG